MSVLDGDAGEFFVDPPLRPKGDVDAVPPHQMQDDGAEARIALASVERYLAVFQIPALADDTNGISERLSGDPIPFLAERFFFFLRAGGADFVFLPPHGPVSLGKLRASVKVVHDQCPDEVRESSAAVLLRFETGPDVAVQIFPDVARLTCRVDAKLLDHRAFFVQRGDIRFLCGLCRYGASDATALPGLRAFGADPEQFAGKASGHGSIVMA